MTLPIESPNELSGWDVTVEPVTQLWSLALPTTEGTLISIKVPLDYFGNGEVLGVARALAEGTGEVFFVKNLKTDPTITCTLPLTPDAGMSHYTMALSPDGRLLAHNPFHMASIVLTDVSGDEPIEIAAITSAEHYSRTNEARWFAFSPDGRHLAYGSSKGIGILAVPTLESAYEWQAPGPVDWVEWADDGRHLITHNGNKTVYVLRLNQLAE